MTDSTVSATQLESIPEWVEDSVVRLPRDSSRVTDNGSGTIEFGLEDGPSNTTRQRETALVCRPYRTLRTVIRRSVGHDWTCVTQFISPWKTVLSGFVGLQNQSVMSSLNVAVTVERSLERR